MSDHSIEPLPNHDGFEWHNNHDEFIHHNAIKKFFHTISNLMKGKGSDDPNESNVGSFLTVGKDGLYFDAYNPAVLDSHDILLHDKSKGKVLVSNSGNMATWVDLPTGKTMTTIANGTLSDLLKQPEGLVHFENLKIDSGISGASNSEYINYLTGDSDVADIYFKLELGNNYRLITPVVTYMSPIPTMLYDGAGVMVLKRD